MRSQDFIFSVSIILQFTFRSDFFRNSLHMRNIFRTAPNIIYIPWLSCIGTQSPFDFRNRIKTFMSNDNMLI